jgi:hypothetical protein
MNIAALTLPVQTIITDNSSNLKKQVNTSQCKNTEEIDRDICEEIPKAPGI